MSLTIASSFARRGRPSAVIRAGVLDSIKSGTIAHQQRSYRFSRICSSYIDPNIYRRLQDFKHNYCDGLSWPPSSEDAKGYWKRAGHRRWSLEDDEPQTAASRKKTPDNPDGVRPGQNIEDAERAPLEHFLFGGKRGRRAKKNARAAMAQGVSTTPSRLADADYVFDPITNRRVPRESLEAAYSTTDQGVDIPVTTFKSYRSQFASFRAPDFKNAPIFPDGAPPEEELRLYRQNKPWESDAQFPKGQQSAIPQNTSSTDSHHGPPSSTLLDTLSGEHKDVQWHPHASHAPVSGAPAAKPLNQHLDAPAESELRQYAPVQDHEVDAQASHEQPVQEYGDLHQYGPVRAHEPDGMYKLDHESRVDAQELGKYEDLPTHEAHTTYAADYTQPPDAAELASYRKPFLSHEPHGKYAANHIPQTWDDAELAKYRTPFFSYEPDGRYAASAAEPKRDDAELARYQPFRSHEPDGKYAAAASGAEEKPAAPELATYGPFRSHEPDGKYAASRAEDKPAAPELATYGPFRSHEPDGKYAASGSGEGSTSMDAAEVRKYQAFRSHEPDGKYAAEVEAEKAAVRETQDLANHEAFGYEDVETRDESQGSKETDAAVDLGGYEAVQLDEPHNPAEASSAYEDYDPAELQKYQAVRWNEPDGKPSESESSEGAVLEYDLKGESPAAAEPKTPFRNKVESLMAQVAAESDAAAPSDSVTKADGQTTKPSGLTGNYVRDFPEDFVKSWLTESSDTVATRPAPEETQSDSGAVQPALERVLKQAPLETTPSDAASTSAPAPTKANQPSLYKILVYDPTMQCIETAETTSIVPDGAGPAPLTPAEVLLRISNPARFFPHFAPLQAQGFEIVSGSGDVLIFRKVRDAVVDDKVSSSTSSSSSSSGAEATAKSSAKGADVVTSVNPIDMTGGCGDYTVAAGRFASPTGFVNYDLPLERVSVDDLAGSKREDGPRESGSGVGEKQMGSKKEGRSRKRSLPRKVAVGTAWVAGAAYSVGVVSEYFKTGGVDGKGPKGL